MWQANLLDDAPVRVDDIAALPLDEFAKDTRVVEFQCPLAPVSFFLVPHPRMIPALVERGVPRGRIWLADELRDLLHAKIPRADLEKVVEAKLLLDGFIPDQERRVA
jgi:hypothetical protein